MKISIEFNLILGAKIDGIPEPIIKENIPAPPPPAGERPAGIIKVPQKIEITQDSTGISGIYSHPVWGSVQATDVSWSPNHIAFTAPSGNDDKNGKTAYFNFSFTLSDSTDCVVGFAGGMAPFFRSFLPLEGIIITRSV